MRGAKHFTEKATHFVEKMECIVRKQKYLAEECLESLMDVIE